MNDENQNPPTDDSNPPTDKPKNKDDFEEKYLRACADLENFRKQVERDKTDFAKFANENCLVALLPILDNFKRAATHLPENLKNDEWVRGVTEVEKQFEQTLENLGLQKIKAKIGELADVTRHEAIATGEGKSGEILKVIEDGYELNNKILRAAKIQVGK